MHSYCLIPGMQSTVRRSRETGELDKHPAWKLRKTNQACGNRLTLKLAQLDQSCKDITSRITHSITHLQNKLKDSQTITNSYTHGSPTTRNDVLYSELEHNKENNSHQLYFDQDKTVCGQQNSRNISPRKKNNSKSTLPAIKQSSKPCYFGATNYRTDCLHFPCVQPETYHSLGFRLDSSTKEWVSWQDLRRAKWGQSESKHYKEDSGSSLMRWCSLPKDFESRKERLLQEISKRRDLNTTKKPPSWAINYGKLTPYKQLSYPVRLHIIKSKV